MIFDNKKINIEYDYMWFIGNRYNFILELKINKDAKVSEKEIIKELENIDYKKFNKQIFKNIKNELTDKKLINDFDKDKVNKIDELEQKINKLNFKTIVVERNKIKDNHILVEYDNTELYDYIINDFIPCFWINKEGNQKQLNDLETKVENILFEANKECILDKINEINVNNTFDIYHLKSINRVNLSDRFEKEM